MLKPALQGGAFALAIAVALAGCNSNGTLNVAAQTDINAALNIICPVDIVVQGAIDAGTLAKPSVAVKSSLKTLAAVCPPNLPPTTIITATVDLLSAYAAIQPLLAEIPTKTKAGK